MSTCCSLRFTVLLVFLWIDIDHSKFQRSVSHREAVRRAHPSPSLSFYKQYFFSCVKLTRPLRLIVQAHLPSVQER